MQPCGSWISRERVRQRREERQRRMNFNGRGIPTHCRCGERVRLLTSNTMKNPGRLFHSCPYGDENNRFHLFKWADGSALEEIEDMQMKICGLEKASSSLVKDNESLNSEIEILIMDTRACESGVSRLESFVTGLEKQLRGFEKELQDSKMEVKGIKNMIVYFVVLVLFFKFVM
ncbi:uncharacterized protein LOC130499586 [Raphanus sativus]|uniref:Uncharacterized protein LOC130499586 n=1 Tax=Raphanus sativus TaxID=3726 RepID=A0A9W3CE47_RAPSA|nr:uncharacterized protein LOC130499586 [Raphanus sativus]